MYKLASSVIASRLKTVLQKIIHEDQKGFLAGRCIGENIRLIYDILFEAKQNEIPGLLLSIDFQQAFDSVSWKFIHKTFDYFNFGPSFKNGLQFFNQALNLAFYKMDIWLSTSACKGDVDKGILFPHIFLSCVQRYSVTWSGRITL